MTPISHFFLAGDPIPTLVSRHILYDRDGNRLDDQAVLKEYGGLSLRNARLDDAAYKARQKQVHLPYPPRVFISYRRSCEERQILINRIVRCLQGLNFEVVSDRDADLQSDADVDRFVAQIAGCSFFVPVVTEDYLEGVGLKGTKTSYVYDELMMAKTARSRGELHIVPVLIEAGFSFQLYDFDAVGYIDAQDGDLDPDKFSPFFNYDGPCMSPSEKEAVSRKTKKAFELHSQGRAGEAAEILSRVTGKFPFIRRAWAGRISSLIKDGQAEEALRLLPAAIAGIPSNEDRSEFIALAMQLSFNAGEREKAFGFALDLFEEVRAAEPRLKVADNVVSLVGRQAGVVQLSNLENRICRAHYVIGVWLDDKGDYLSARNHMLAALADLKKDEVFLNDLGYVFKNLGCWDSARRFFSGALEVNPAYRLADLNLVQLLYAKGDVAGCRQACLDLLSRPEFKAEAPKLEHFLNELTKQQSELPANTRTYKDYLLQIAPAPWLKCSKCAALYPSNSTIINLCGRCAGLYQAHLDRCYHCRSDALVPVDVAANFGAENVFARCPTCKMGRLEIDENPDLCAVD